MNIAVVGTGFVGLVSAACFASFGHQVACMDIDRAKLDKLQAGIVPFVEEGLEELLHQVLQSGHLMFTDDLGEALEAVECVFLCVGTPSRTDGSADLSMVLEAARSIGELASGPLLTVLKSTVPVGTNQQVRAVIEQALAERGQSFEVDVLSNPEFLREGTAVYDFLNADRVVIGGRDPQHVERIAALYRNFVPEERILRMDAQSAEMSKYAANCFLATKISFINEIATLCELLEADIDTVREVLGTDPRIGRQFLSPGIGYGGSCLPKDVKALLHLADTRGYHAQMLQAAEDINRTRRHRLIEKVKRSFGEGGLQNQKVAVLGLAFKPGTSDMRESPALTVVQELQRAGATVCVYDPVAMEEAHRWLNEPVVYADSPYACAERAEALILLTEWQEFVQLNWERVVRNMAVARIFDARNALDPQSLAQAGAQYYGVGRRPVETRIEILS